MRNNNRSFGSQSSNESKGPPNKPSTNDLLSAKARLRKGSSEYATEISEGVSQPVESPPPPALPDSSPPKSPPPNTSLIYTDTPKEGSPGSSPNIGRLGMIFDQFTLSIPCLARPSLCRQPKCSEFQMFQNSSLDMKKSHNSLMFRVLVKVLNKDTY